MRRLFPLSAVALMLSLLVPAASASTVTQLDVSVVKAPVAPDGTTAGEITDIVVNFVGLDPAVDGISMLTDGTVTVTLPDEFDNTGEGGPNVMVLLQGWPQSPPAPPPAFLWTTTVAGNTITATLDADFLVGVFGPGPKQAHLLLNSFRNPGPGTYDVDLVIQPDPGSPDTFEGVGTVHILPKARRSIDAVSVFSGAPGPPPPFNNAIYQTVTAGADANDVGLYLWDKRSSVADGVIHPMLGVDIAMSNARNGRLVQGKKTVGHVKIDAPKGARDYGISTTGPSSPGISFVTGLDVGILITTFSTDPDAIGRYTISLRLNNGNTQTLFVDAE